MNYNAGVKPGNVPTPCHPLRRWMILILSSLCAISTGYPDDKSESSQPPRIDERVDTSSTVTIDGVDIEYNAKAGRLVLRHEDGAPKASIFYTAYFKKKHKGPDPRPITFAFNGGPGSASVWLHLGILGPQRILMDDKGFMMPPPFRLVDNEFSLLDKSDLVFIDPVSTGFSRADTDDKAAEYHGFEGDLKSVAEFIRLFVTRHGLWLSPKFLIGESYGTTRAAGLSTVLQEDHGMYLNGIMLISSVLQFQTIRFAEGNDLPYVLFFPSYTATAYHHGVLDAHWQSQPLADVLRESEEFAVQKLAPALILGNAMNPEQRRQLIEKAAALTGLSTEFVGNSHLRIDAFSFMKELLRDRGLTVGRFDSRYTGSDKSDLGTEFEFDPSFAHILGPFTAAMNHYVREVLRYESDLPYEILTGRVQPWDYSPYSNRYVETAERLRRSMAFNPYLHLYVASGYTDLATPYFATDYTLRNLGLRSSDLNRIHVHYYPAGHMMYLERQSLKTQKSDLASFIDLAVSAAAQDQGIRNSP
ncbi:MAG: peptidase S10 [Verrucomicrobia bacterium]|nr:peptidase S10 [Verrucomicrobiota bacterium]